MKRTRYDHVNYVWTPFEAMRHYLYLLEADYEQNEGPFHMVALKVRNHRMLCNFNRHYNEYSKFLGHWQSYQLDVEELETITTWSFGPEVIQVWKDLASSRTTPLVRDFIAWINLKLMMATGRIMDNFDYYSPAWDGADFIKLYDFGLKYLTDDDHEKGDFLLTLPYHRVTLLVNTLEACSDEKLVKVSKHRKLPSQEEKDLLTVAHDYFTHFQQRLQVTKRALARDGDDLTATLDYSAEQVKAIHDFVKSTYLPTYSGVERD